MNTAENVIAALRLAVEASADDDVLRRVAVELLACAPPSDPNDTAAVKLFIEAIRAVDVKLVVTDHETAIGEGG